MKRELFFEDHDFRKSSRSQAYPFLPFNCVMVAVKEGAIAVRDSKDPEKKTLVFDNHEWTAFIEGVKNGEFDI